MKKALIVYGGWDGHEPDKVSAIFKDVLEKEGFNVNRSDTLESYRDVEYLKSLDLIVPVWTAGELPSELEKPVLEAVASGVGMAGCHGGMCDSFRQNTEWQFMTGAQWVSHPGGEVDYKVNIMSKSNPITEGLKDFDVRSEQYYIHIDPVVEVLASTRFPNHRGWYETNNIVDVPVVFTKRWGHGRVFYNSLGHVAKVFEIYEALELMRRGFLWAAEGKEIAVKNNLTLADFE